MTLKDNVVYLAALAFTLKSQVLVELARNEYWCVIGLRFLLKLG